MAFEKERLAYLAQVVMKPLCRRRSLVALGSACAVPMILASLGQAQTILPDKSLRLLVGFAAGGGSELMARAMAPKLERRLGRRVTVENKRSGPGMDAGEFFKKDLEQGLVMAFMPTTTLAPKLAGSPFPFDSQSKLVPLTTAGTFQVALAVSPDIGVSTFAEYVAWVKANPSERGRLGTTATDDYLKIYAMMIGREIGVPLEIVPHLGAARLVHAIVDGKVPAGLGSITTLMEHNYGGEVKVLMTSGRKRATVLRDVPTSVELGYPNLELTEWYGFFASSASPSPIVAEWNRQLRLVLADSEVIAALAQLGLDVETSTQEETAARFVVHLKTWEARLQSFGMKTVN
jgi:tripartite-type tricarboxylate transporter receptor subunit TctC